MLKTTKTCAKCKKIFPALYDEELCAKCRGAKAEKLELIREAFEQFGRRTPEDIADFTAISLDEVKHLLDTPEGKELINTSLPVCVLCKARPAQPKHPFCLYCRLELNKAIGSAKGELFKKLEVEQEHPERMKPHHPSGLADALARKRRGTASRFTPRNKYS